MPTLAGDYAWCWTITSSLILMAYLKDHMNGQVNNLYSHVWLGEPKTDEEL